MPGFSEIAVKSPHHAKHLLQGFCDLLKCNQFCDCTLLLNDSKYLIHKSLFAASSAYFKALFTSSNSWRESGKLEIRLNGIPAQSFQSVVDFIYTGEIILNENMISEIYATADMLQFKHLKEICHDYLINQLCSSNCIGIWRHAKLYNNRQLQQFTWQYILIDFAEVKECSEFLEQNFVDLVSILSFVLKSNEVSATQIIRAISIWLIRNGSVKSRERKLHTLAEILKHLQSLKLGPMVWFSDVLSSDIMCPHTHEKETYEKALVIVGGYNEGLVRTCERLCEDSLSWKNLTEWDLSGSNHYHWVGLIGVRIYAIAGSSPIKIDTVLSRLTVQAKKQLQSKVLGTDWEYEATAPHDCSNMRFCVMDNCIYGCGVVEESTKMQVCRYDPGSGTWDFLTELDSDPRVFFQLISYQGRLYILGGMSTAEEKALSLCEVYDPNSKTCEALSNMTHPRYHFGTTIMDVYMYAVGGYGIRDMLLRSVERYNFEEKNWSSYIYLPSPAASMVCCALQDKLFCIGGEGCANGGHSTLKTNAIALNARGRWTNLPLIHKPRLYCSTIHLY